MQLTDLNIYHLSTIHIEPEIMQNNLVVSIPYLKIQDTRSFI